VRRCEPPEDARVGGWREARRHADRALFLCWPPISRLAEKCLRAYHAAGGSTVAYVGEGGGGCTADDRFFGLLESHWETVEEIAIPQWWGLHDWLWIYRRKENNS
jgi:hypothetical protein